MGIDSQAKRLYKKCLHYVCGVVVLGIKEKGREEMREFKFRAWSGNRFLNQDEFCIMDGKVFDNDNGLPSHYVVEQFTGLKDKKGVEIYEGDIFLNGASERVIEFRGGNCHAMKPDKTESILLSFIVNAPLNIVIGNIHENPELIDP